MTDERQAGLRAALRHWRTSAGFTLREAASRVAADFTHLSKIENGHDRPSRRLVAELDAVYHADGALVATYDSEPCPRCGRGAALAVAQVPAQEKRLDEERRHAIWDGIEQAVALTAQGPDLLEQTARPGFERHQHADGSWCQRKITEQGAQVPAQSDREALRERIFTILHRSTCGEPEPHPWTDHLPWDDPEDEPDAIALADELIEALAAGRAAAFRLESLAHVPTPDELDELLSDISAAGYASEAREIVENWTRKWWGVESAFTTKWSGGVTCDAGDPPCHRWTGHEGPHADGGDCPTCHHPHVPEQDGSDGGCIRCECEEWR